MRVECHLSYLSTDISELEELASLHQHIKNCDQTLEDMQHMLNGFQAHLGVHSICILGFDNFFVDAFAGCVCMIVAALPSFAWSFVVCVVVEDVSLAPSLELFCASARPHTHTTTRSFTLFRSFSSCTHPTSFS